MHLDFEKKQHRATKKKNIMIPQNYYSSTAHVRNRRRDIKGNILQYVIPGLKKSIDIPFPDRKLPVCKRCKKIYKTRELCRIRDGHTDIPWNTTYICITLDESCITRNAAGDMCLVDEEDFQFVARSITGPPMPYRAKSGTIGGTKTPICMACKDKNYTRHHCREKQAHQQLPWNTVYVMLSAVPIGYAHGPHGHGSGHGPGGLNTDDVGLRSGSKRSSSSVSSDDRETKKIRSEDNSDCVTLSSDGNTETEKPVEDDIRKIETSRAVLIIVGKDECSIHVSISFISIKCFLSPFLYPLTQIFFFLSLKWLEIDPLVPRNCNNDYSSDPWKNSENVEPMPGQMMNGNFNQSNWQSFNGPQGPSSKFHPMMGMGMGGMGNGMSSGMNNGMSNGMGMGMGGMGMGGMGNMGGMGMGGMGNMGGMGMGMGGGMGNPNGNVPQCYPTNSNFDRDFERYSPTSAGSMRPPSDRPSSGSFQSYDSNYGMNGPMGGSGMMNGPGQYNSQGMYGPQHPFSDDRENVNGNNFPSQSHKQYYEGCGPSGMPGMGGNMMGMNRNYNEYNNSRNSYGSYPPMHMQNGYPHGGGGPEFFRRSYGNGPSNGNQSFQPTNIKMDPSSSIPPSKKHHGPMHQQGPHLQEHVQYNNSASKNSNKPPMLI